MNVYEFNALPDQEQMAATCEAVELCQRTEDNMQVTLYALDNFYIEVYRLECTLIIWKINSFANVKLLDPYLEQIDISFLVFY